MLVLNNESFNNWGFHNRLSISAAIARARGRHLERHSATAIVAHHGHGAIVIVIIIAVVTSVEKSASTSLRNGTAEDILDDLSTHGKLTTSYGI